MTDIFMTACFIFRKEYIKGIGVDPFSHVTIASACMVFLTKFLLPKTLVKVLVFTAFSG